MYYLVGTSHSTIISKAKINVLWNFFFTRWPLWGHSVRKKIKKRWFEAKNSAPARKLQFFSDFKTLWYVLLVFYCLSNCQLVQSHCKQNFWRAKAKVSSIFPQWIKLLLLRTYFDIWKNIINFREHGIRILTSKKNIDFDTSESEHL